MLETIDWLFGFAPASSYYYMSEPGSVVVVQPTPPPENDLQPIIDELRVTVDALDNRLDTATSEAREWITSQLQSITEKLATLEANSRNGLEGLASQVQEIRQQIADISTRNLPAPPLAEEVLIVPLAPPEVPTPPSEEGGGPPDRETNPPAPDKPKPKKRVI